MELCWNCFAIIPVKHLLYEVPYKWLIILNGYFCHWTSWKHKKEKTFLSHKVALYPKPIWQARHTGGCLSGSNRGVMNMLNFPLIMQMAQVTPWKGTQCHSYSTASWAPTEVSLKLVCAEFKYFLLYEGKWEAAVILTASWSWNYSAMLGLSLQVSKECLNYLFINC